MRLSQVLRYHRFGVGTEGPARVSCFFVVSVQNGRAFRLPLRASVTDRFRSAPFRARGRTNISSHFERFWWASFSFAAGPRLTFI